MAPAPRGTVLHCDSRWCSQVRGTQLLPACVLGDPVGRLLAIAACALTMSFSPLRRVCAESLMTLALEKAVELGSEPRAAVLGSQSRSRGNCVQKQRAADLGVKGIYLGSQAWDWATNGPVIGDGGLIQPAVHSSPFRHCCPHCPVSLPLRWLLSVSTVLTTLWKRGQFLDDTLLPSLPPPPFCKGFPAVLLGEWTKTVATSDWPGVTHESADLLGSVPCKAAFPGPNAYEPD